MHMIDGYIYIFTNKINKKVYIGKTTNINRRYKEHINIVGKSVFHSALKKYGVENFDFDVIEHISCDNINDVNDELDKLEIKYISQYNKNNYKKQ